MRKYVLLFSLIILLPNMVFGQLKSQNKPMDIGQVLRTPTRTFQGIGNILGIDPSKLNVSQSYSLSYFSLSGQSFAQGLYLNTIDYEFSAPLSMRLQWGVAHSPMSKMGAPSVLNDGPFISAAQLKFRPSNKIAIGIEYRALPYYYQNNYNYRGRNFWQDEW
jgi:hypothetical protein